MGGGGSVVSFLGGATLLHGYSTTIAVMAAVQASLAAMEAGDGCTGDAIDVAARRQVGSWRGQDQWW